MDIDKRWGHGISLQRHHANIPRAGQMHRYLKAQCMNLSEPKPPTFRRSAIGRHRLVKRTVDRCPSDAEK
jgi:hypothetical protein